LFTNGEIQVTFKIADGDLDVVIENIHGGENLTDQSEGETRLAGLITSFSIRETLVSHGLLVVDEPGEGLDAANCAAFAQGLETVARKFGTVFVTTHNPNLLSHLNPDRHLLVVKENGISMVTEVPV
jgi:DNA repair exonuclease SbcCD ATPase subunit